MGVTQSESSSSQVKCSRVGGKIVSIKNIQKGIKLLGFSDSCFPASNLLNVSSSLKGKMILMILKRVRLSDKEKFLKSRVYFVSASDVISFGKNSFKRREKEMGEEIKFVFQASHLQTLTL